jgi:hypothetical protein
MHISIPHPLTILNILIFNCRTDTALRYVMTMVVHKTYLWENFSKQFMEMKWKYTNMHKVETFI